MKSNCACYLIGFCLLGCTPSQPADSAGNRATPSHEHKAMTSLPTAVQQLNVHVETIGKAFASKTPDDAHDALHDVRPLLKSIRDLAKDLSDEKKIALKTSVDELSECFDALDLTLHGGTETPYSKVEERISTAMAGLRTAIE